MPTYTIGELAKVSGVTPRTIRYYVEMGLLAPPEGAGRAAGYSEEHLERLAAIKGLQADRLSLEEIRDELAATPQGAAAMLASPQAAFDERAAERMRSASGAPSPAPEPAPGNARTVRRDSAAEYLARLRESRAMQGPGVREPAEAWSTQQYLAYDVNAAPLPQRPPYPKPAERGETYVAEPWVRIPLAPDIELHVRGKLNDPRVSRLIREARRVLQEEGKPHEDNR